MIAYSSISHIAQSVLLGRAGDALIACMADYTAYLDDGGHPDDQAVVLVAGFIAEITQWKYFECEWREVLESKHIPENVFHMTDFESRNKESFYCDWPDSERRWFLWRLLSIIRRRTRKHFVRVMPMEDYAAINSAVTFEECHGSPFAFSGRAVAAGIKEWKTTYAKPEDQVLIIFEDGSKHKGDLMEVFKRDKLRTPLFQSKKDVLPLQAADVLAWECFNAYKTGWVRSSFEELLKMPSDHGIFDVEQLIRICKEDKTPGRLAIPPDFEVVFHSTPKRLRRRTVKREPNEYGIWGATRGAQYSHGAEEE